MPCNSATELQCNGMQDKTVYAIHTSHADACGSSTMHARRPMPIDIAATQRASSQRSNSSTPKERTPVLKRVKKMNAQHAANGALACPPAGTQASGLLHHLSETITCKVHIRNN
jgi:hypothetical protein